MLSAAALTGIARQDRRARTGHVLSSAEEGKSSFWMVGCAGVGVGSGVHLCGRDRLRHLRSWLPPAHAGDGGGLAEQDREQPPDKPWWATVAVGVSHCGAGCTLGDIIAAFGIYFLTLTIAGEALLAEYVGDYILAVGLGLVFQYLAIAPMRGLGLRKGILAAAKADILSLTGFEVGLYGWMALTSLVFFPSPHIHPDSPVYWFMMQIS